ncbi:sugar ABC transporter permease [Microbacterium kribbense]|uniref:Sugar ABC transporter permease n=1 Tax=Microbacterium kribbense TaxID=433645 RepID=A0ABP7G521_9MICO
MTHTTQVPTTTPSAPGVRAPRRRRGGHTHGAAFASRGINLLYLPALAVVIVFTVYPFIQGISLSFTNWNGYSPQKSWVGAVNYLRLFTDANFGQALGNTLIYGFGSTIIQQVLGLALALALDRAIRGRGLARAIIYLPVLVSPVVMGTMYYLFFAYGTGGFNDIVVAFGGERIPVFADAAAATAIITIVNSVQFVGISMVIYLAGLQAIPVMYYEAARVDGAGTWTQFTNVTMPMLQPAFVTSIVINLIGGLKLFDVIRVLTGGGPGYATNSVSTLISKTYFGNQNAGYASAMGVALFLLIAAFTLVVNTLLNKRRLELS